MSAAARPGITKTQIQQIAMIAGIPPIEVYRIYIGEKGRRGKVVAAVLSLPPGTPLPPLPSYQCDDAPAPGMARGMAEYVAARRQFAAWCDRCQRLKEDCFCREPRIRESNK